MARTTITIMIFTQELPISFRCGQWIVVQRLILNDSLKVFDTNCEVTLSSKRYFIAREVPNIFTYDIHNNYESSLQTEDNVPQSYIQALQIFEIGTKCGHRFSIGVCGAYVISTLLIVPNVTHCLYLHVSIKFYQNSHFLSTNIKYVVL